MIDSQDFCDGVFGLFKTGQKTLEKAVTQLLYDGRINSHLLLCTSRVHNPQFLTCAPHKTGRKWFSSYLPFGLFTLCSFNTCSMQTNILLQLPPLCIIHTPQFQYPQHADKNSAAVTSSWIIHTPQFQYPQHEDKNSAAVTSPEGRLGMSDVSPLSGIPGLSFDSTLLSPLLFFCLVLLPFLSDLFLPAGPFFWTFSRKFFNIFRKEIGFFVWLLFSS